MLNIQITKDYKICSDERNFIVLKKRNRKDKNIIEDNEDNIVEVEGGYKILGYYPTFEMAVADLTEAMVGDLNANKLKELSLSIQELKNAVIRTRTQK